MWEWHHALHELVYHENLANTAGVWYAGGRIVGGLILCLSLWDHKPLAFPRWHLCVKSQCLTGTGCSAFVRHHNVIDGLIQSALPPKSDNQIALCTKGNKRRESREGRVQMTHRTKHPLRKKNVTHGQRRTFSIWQAGRNFLNPSPLLQSSQGSNQQAWRVRSQITIALPTSVP